MKAKYVWILKGKTDVGNSVISATGA